VRLLLWGSACSRDEHQQLMKHPFLCMLGVMANPRCRAAQRPRPLL
jgi:hypothetical protein